VCKLFFVNVDNPYLVTAEKIDTLSLIFDRKQYPPFFELQTGEFYHIFALSYCLSA